MPSDPLGAATTYDLGMSIVAEYTTAPADTQPPSLAPGLTMTGATGTTITLSRTASTDNVGVAGARLPPSRRQWKIRRVREQRSRSRPTLTHRRRD
jgi:uncharacterized membrane protein